MCQTKHSLYKAANNAQNLKKHTEKPMIKKTIKLTVSFISYFILCFILIYSLLLFKMNTKISALLLSIYISFTLSISFCILQNILAVKKEDKIRKIDMKNKQMQHLLDVDDAAFIEDAVSFFQIENIIRTDDISIITNNEVYVFVRQLSELSQDQALKLTRVKKANPQKSFYCILICPYSKDTKEKLDSKGIQIISQNRISEFAASVYVENPENQHAHNTKLFSKIKMILLEKKTTKACIKYAIVFFALSIFTYNKLWYIIASLILVIFGICSVILRRKYYSNTIV